MKSDSPADLQTAAVTDTTGLEALAVEWQNLALDCVHATVFQTYEWNAAWWRHFGRHRRLHVVTFRAADGCLVGIAPLMTAPWYGGPLRRLSFVGTGASDYLDILAVSGRESAVAETLYHYLGRWAGWDVADLQQLREGGLLRLQSPPGRQLYSYDADQEPCPYLPLAADWESTIASLGKKTRYNIGYYGRSLEKLHDVEFGWASAENLDDELTCLFELHQRRWNKRWLPGVFGTRRAQMFHRDAARALQGRDWLRLFHLRLDGSTEASLYCFSYGDRLCYYQGGFEPSFAKLSLGTVLTARAIQTAISDGKTVFDFLRGDEPYKAKWTGSTRRNTRRLMAHSLAMAPLVHAVQQIEDRVEVRVKEWARHLR